MTEEVRLADNTYRVKAANWNLQRGAHPEQRCHLRTSAPASVGISIEFRAASRHTYRSFAPFSGIHPREVVRLSGGLPRQCAHWLAMTGNSIARQIPNLSFCCGKPISNFFSIPYLQSDFSRRSIHVFLKNFPGGLFFFVHMCYYIKNTCADRFCGW